jgi:hypothetical protein
MVIRYFKILIAFSIMSFGTTGFCFAGQTDFSVKGGYFMYWEPDPDISISGQVIGIQGSYRKIFSAYSIKVQSEFMTGNLSYNGSLNIQRISEKSTQEISSGFIPLRHASKLWFSDSAVLAGKSFIKHSYSITPYAGLGLRHLNSPKNQNVLSDYSRKVTYFYLPMVLEFKKNISEKSFWGASGEVDILLLGSVKANLSEVSKNYNNLKFHQSLGGGFKLGLQYSNEISGYSIFIKPFLDIWVMNDSDTDELKYGISQVMVRSSDGSYGNYCEPANITLTTGLQFGVRF